MNDNVVNLHAGPLSGLTEEKIRAGVERGARISTLAQAAGMAVVMNAQLQEYPEHPDASSIFDIGMALGLALIRIAVSTPPDMVLEDAVRAALSGVSAGMSLGARESGIDLNAIVNAMGGEPVNATIVAFKGE